MRNKDYQVLSNFNQFLELVSHWKNNYLDFGNGIKLYRAEIHIIKVIHDDPGIYMSEIARTLGVTRAVIGKTITRLEKKGYVCRVIDKDDKKRFKLYLTELGQRANDQHLAFHQQQDGYIFDYLSSLDGKNLTVINEFLNMARRMVENHYESNLRHENKD